MTKVGLLITDVSCEDIYDMIYTFLAAKGREALFFGTRQEAARRAFTRSYAGTEFPTLWFELPLLGKPWFDLHVLTDTEKLAPEEVDEARLPQGVAPIFRRFAKKEGARQLALSWDVGAEDDPTPAVQIMVRESSVNEEFLECVGGPEAAGAYRAFRRRVPEEMFTCYTGVFPGRNWDKALIRIENIPGDDLSLAFENDPKLLERHLKDIGVPPEVAAEVAARFHEFVPPPCVPEFQFDVNADGTVGETFSISIRFGLTDDDPRFPLLTVDSAAGDMMRKAEAWGVADDRWQRLPETNFARRILGAPEGSLLFCYPAYLKLKWKDGALFDAKSYLAAGTLQFS